MAEKLAANKIQTENPAGTTPENMGAKDNKQETAINTSARNIGTLALKYAFDKSETVNDPALGAITAPLYMTTTDIVPKESKIHIDIPYTSPSEEYTEAQLKENPALRYQADPNKFPLFALQSEKRSYADPGARLPLDYTLSNFLGRTVSTVLTLSGEDASFGSKEKLPAADHVIYLDKSARPVSWLVDEFWDDFSDRPRPEKSYLAIDRSPWLQRAGQDVDQDGIFISGPKRGQRANFSDFVQRADELVSKDILAKIRALYIEGGITSEGPDEIFNTPTILDGKNITIVDEVRRSGTTINVAKWLIERAIPEAKSVNIYGFWNALTLTDPVTGKTEISSAPVWYDKDRTSGRGVAEIRPTYYDEVYAANSTPVNLAKKFAGDLIGTPFNPDSEQSMDAHFGSPSLELYKEIGALRDEYIAGRVFLPPTPELGARYMSYMKKEGLTGPADRFSEHVPPTSISYIPDKLRSRPAVKF